MVVHLHKNDKTDHPDEASLPDRREMDLESWIGIKDNPRQRDTERHAAKAIRHLREWQPTQNVVAMAETDHGQSWKLDGHTRCWLWERGDIPQPHRLLVDVYKVKNAAEASRLYLNFDARGATDTVVDEVHGALRAAGFEPISPLLKRRQFGSALKYLYRIFNPSTEAKQHPEFTYRVVSIFLDEIKLLDKCNPAPLAFPTGVIMGAILTLRKRGDRSLDFWTRYARGEGSKIGLEMDAAEALSKYVQKRRLQKNTSAGGSIMYDIFNRSVKAAEDDLINKTFSRGLREMTPLVFNGYLASTPGVGQTDE